VYDVFFHHHLSTYEFPPGYGGSGAIRAQFLQLFTSLNPRTSAVALRKRILRQHRPHWKLLRSTTKCFLCMVRPSERMLPCGHSLCEECIQDYYPWCTNAYTYRVGICEFCGVDALSVFSRMPTTVEPNIAAIDGGGVRGLVALVLLKRLQAALDTGHHIREYFDYFIGTSAGMCIWPDPPSQSDRLRRAHRVGSRSLPVFS
jgi:hypothetical protein